MLEQLKKDLRSLKAKQRRTELIDHSISLQKEIDEVKELIELEKIKETPLTTFSDLLIFIQHEIFHLINNPNHWGSPKNVAREIQIFKSAEVLSVVDDDFFEERQNFDNIELLEAVAIAAIETKANIQKASFRQLARKNNLKK